MAMNPLEYSDRAFRPRSKVDNDLPPVRVKRAWRGVQKGQLMPGLPLVRRNHLLRAGFLELVPEAEAPKAAAKKKASKKK